MATFLGKDFLLKTPVSKVLYHEYAKNLPIFDFHCHLSPKEIYEDHRFSSITEAWLGGDHYKWRLLREFGIPECGVTGVSDDYQKFLSFAKLMPLLIGNPIYEWTHMELRKYFGIEETLSMDTAKKIYDKANSVLKTLTARKMIELNNVTAIFTTDDPLDDLRYHELLLNDSSFHINVFPCFRPDKAFGIEKEGFKDYISLLEKTVSYKITSFELLEKALDERLYYFALHGCSASDQAFDKVYYNRKTDEDADVVFKKGLQGETLSLDELDTYKGRLLVHLGKSYKKMNISQQYHFGAIRNNNSLLYESLGPDTGFDSVSDSNIAVKLSSLLDELNSSSSLPRTIIYALNPKDYPSIVSLINCFQFEKGSLQLGAAWWFNDHHDGIVEQLKVLSAGCMISEFVGMLTDSRSFLSYPRHDYFRRIFCNYLGELVEEGRYPEDIDTLGKLVTDVCLNNAKRFFRK
ncbi:MAG: glucuronate isomerase [Bacilli bacterium]